MHITFSIHLYTDEDKCNHLHFVKKKKKTKNNQTPLNVEKENNGYCQVTF